MVGDILSVKQEFHPHSIHTINYDRDQQRCLITSKKFGIGGGPAVKAGTGSGNGSKYFGMQSLILR